MVFSLFRLADKVFEKASYWIPGVIGVWIGMSWLAREVAPIGQYGWPADFLAGVIFTSIAMSGVGLLLSGWRYFNPSKQIIVNASLVSGAQENTKADALEIRFEESDLYSQVHQLESGIVQRFYSLRLYNHGNGFVTDTIIFLKNTSPAMQENTLKLMAPAEALPLGHYRTVKLVQYPEIVPDRATTPDKIVLGWFHAGGYMYGPIPTFNPATKEFPLVVEIEAQARECSPCKATFRIWIDEDPKRLRVQKY